MLRVTVDAVGTGASPPSRPAFISWASGSVTAGSYAVAVVGYLPFFGGPIVSVTYDGVGMTLLGTSTFGSGANQVSINLYGLANVPAGSKTVLVTPTDNCYMAGNSATLLNVAAIGALQTAGALSTLQSQAVACASGELAVQSFCSRGSNGTGAFSTSSGYTGGTNLYNTIDPFGGLSLSTTPADDTFASVSSASTYWTGAAIVFSPPPPIIIVPTPARLTATGGTPVITFGVVTPDTRQFIVPARQPAMVPLISRTCKVPSEW